MKNNDLFNIFNTTLTYLILNHSYSEIIDNLKKIHFHFKIKWYTFSLVYLLKKN